LLLLLFVSDDDLLVYFDFLNRMENVGSLSFIWRFDCSTFRLYKKLAVYSVDSP
jgi:hypothetical protein